jgi:hypothetical protein
MGESPWAGGDIVEVAALLTFPRVVSCRRQPENAKRVSEREHVSGAFHGAKEV